MVTNTTTVVHYAYDVYKQYKWFMYYVLSAVYMWANLDFSFFR